MTNSTVSQCPIHSDWANLAYLDPNFANPETPAFGDPNLGLPISCPNLSDFLQISDSAHGETLQEDPDFSDAILSYINQMLMEDLEDKDCVVQEPSMELRVAEKSFYDAIGERYPPGEDLVCFSNGCSYEFADVTALGSVNWQCDYSGGVFRNFGSVSSCARSAKTDSFESPMSDRHCDYSDGVFRSFEYVSKTDSLESSYSESDSVSLFIKGVEEAKKLIPDTTELVVGSRGLQKRPNGQCSYPGDALEACSEESRAKQASVSHDDSNEHDCIFDEILLNHAGDQNKAVVSLRETLKNESIRKMERINGLSKGPGSRKRQSRKKVVDLRTLLVSCAHAVTSGDQRRANELLVQIKQNSSPYGDGNQRLAHYLAEGLETRLAGNGSSVYRSLVGGSSISSTDVLKAYLVYLAACPFRKVANIFSNKTISKMTQSAAKIHIIDFGILYGFQWPTFIQRQSQRIGGSPKIRITGVDFPQPGFRPAQRVEETGRRLSHYAKEFGVPFEFNPVAKRWESIHLEDLKLEDDEVVIVNCIYRMKNLPDETMVADRSRNAIFDMVRQINPAVFIQGVVNGAYNAPFFLTRFKEALFHFSALFDMLETVMPRESEERMLLERLILGREALNVVACEGWERVERPETYKQWQTRSSRAGFVQLPLNQEIKDRARLRVKAYHKDFVIDQDGHWLLLGWKGRIVNALSTWKPA